MSYKKHSNIKFKNGLKTSKSHLFCISNEKTDLIAEVQMFFISRFSLAIIHDPQHIRGGGAISVTPLYHFHSLHRHLVTSRSITAESSSLQ